MCLLFKLIYFGFGTQQIVQRDCERIEQKIDLYLDNELVKLPELQSIVFLNIDSWGAGCKLCGKLCSYVLNTKLYRFFLFRTKQLGRAG